MRKQEAIKREGSALMSKEDAARPVAETESSRSRCIFLPDVYVPCEVVRENVITERLWK